MGSFWSLFRSVMKTRDVREWSDKRILHWNPLQVLSKFISAIFDVRWDIHEKLLRATYLAPWESEPTLTRVGLLVGVIWEGKGFYCTKFQLPRNFFTLWSFFQSNVFLDYYHRKETEIVRATKYWYTTSYNSVGVLPTRTYKHLGTRIERNVRTRVYLRKFSHICPS